MRFKMLFNEKLDLKLIQAVKDNPVIYNTNDAQYVNFNQREVSWQKIGDALRRPAAVCKARWVNIRDSHRRLLRKCQMFPQTRYKPYKYDKELQFVKPFYRDITYSYDCSEFDDDDNADRVNFDDDIRNDDMASSEDEDVKNVVPAKSKRKKRKRSSVDTKPHIIISRETPPPTTSEFDISDPVDAFLVSIGATLKTFSPYHLNLAKSKIFNVVQEHDLQQIVDNSREGGSQYKSNESMG